MLTLAIESLIVYAVVCAILSTRSGWPAGRYFWTGALATYLVCLLYAGAVALIATRQAPAQSVDDLVSAIDFQLWAMAGQFAIMLLAAVAAGLWSTRLSARKKQAQ